MELNSILEHNVSKYPWSSEPRCWVWKWTRHKDTDQILQWATLKFWIRILGVISWHSPYPQDPLYPLHTHTHFIHHLISGNCWFYSDRLWITCFCIKALCKVLELDEISFSPLPSHLSPSASPSHSLFRLEKPLQNKTPLPPAEAAARHGAVTHVPPHST